MFEITTYKENYLEEIIGLILSIQQNEFNIPVTLDAQPDLLKIPEIYQAGKGNFWIALHEDRLIGTIGLIDIGDNMGVLRKMFVNAAYRGSEHGAAHQLMQTLLQWCHEKEITTILLGTVERLKASHRFYEKNGFVRIEKELLPEQFPLMKVDTMFYQLQLI